MTFDYFLSILSIYFCFYSYAHNFLVLVSWVSQIAAIKDLRLYYIVLGGGLAQGRKLCVVDVEVRVTRFQAQ